MQLLALFLSLWLEKTCDRGAQVAKGKRSVDAKDNASITQLLAFVAGL